MDFRKEILKSIQELIDKSIGNYKSDRTYQSVIKQVTKKGYIVIDQSGCERTVKCCIPNLTLKAGQRVWIKEPLGEIRNLHICGIV